MGGDLRSIICYLGVNSQDVTGLWIREMINMARMCFSPFVQATHDQTIKPPVFSALQEKENIITIYSPKYIAFIIIIIHCKVKDFLRCFHDHYFIRVNLE